MADSACSSISDYSTISVRAAGKDWTLARPADLESLWEAIASDESAAAEFAEDERLPYWVELWPASIALADWLHSRAVDLRGRNCLDLGCGLGLTALVAAGCGAKVLAVDYEKDALLYAGKNAALNGVSPEPCWTVMDWRSPALSREGFAFIWGGDIMYERRFVAPVLACLEYALAPGGKVWLAEPNRNVYDEFRAALIRRGWSSNKVMSGVVEPLHVQKNKVSVTLWELCRGPAGGAE